MTAPEPQARRRVLEARDRGRLRNSLPTPEECRAIRLAASLSVREFAAALGVSSAVLGDWETGRRRPSSGFRERYAEGLRLLQDSPL